MGSVLTTDMGLIAVRATKSRNRCCRALKIPQTTLPGLQQDAPQGRNQVSGIAGPSRDRCPISPRLLSGSDRGLPIRRLSPAFPRFQRGPATRCGRPADSSSPTVGSLPFRRAGDGKTPPPQGGNCQPEAPAARAGRRLLTLTFAVDPGAAARSRRPSSQSFRIEYSTRFTSLRPVLSSR